MHDGHGGNTIMVATTFIQQPSSLFIHSFMIAMVATTFIHSFISNNTATLDY
jgi:hypothetical protein